MMPGNIFFISNLNGLKSPARPVAGFFVCGIMVRFVNNIKGGFYDAERNSFEWI